LEYLRNNRRKIMAADSVLNYDDIEDIRYNPFTGVYTPKQIGYAGNPVERRTVPNTSPYQIKLFEVPQETIPSVMRVVPSVGGSALIEVGFNQVPASGEYRVSYSGILGAGIIEFNSAQAGVQMDVSYYGLGHINQKISLDTRVPSTGNTTIAGNKTFSGITTFSENIISEKKISTGGENSPDVDDGGICLQQNAGDGKIITFKSSDIAHGITDYAETDTYGYLQKRHAPSGGLYIVGLGEDYYGCAILGINTTVDNTETTSSHAPVNIIGAKKSGTNVSTVGADENVVTLNNLGTTRFIMKGDGELWTDYAVVLQMQYKYQVMMMKMI